MSALQKTADYEDLSNKVPIEDKELLGYAEKLRAQLGHYLSSQELLPQIKDLSSIFQTKKIDLFVKEVRIKAAAKEGSSVRKGAGSPGAVVLHSRKKAEKKEGGVPATKNVGLVPYSDSENGSPPQSPGRGGI